MSSANSNQTTPQQPFRLFDLPKELQLMVWREIFQLDPANQDPAFLAALALNRTLYAQARYEWLKFAHVTIHNEHFVMQRSEEETLKLEHLYITWDQRQKFDPRGKFLELRFKTKTNIKTITMDLGPSFPNRLTHLLDIVETSGSLRKVTIRLAHHSHSSYNPRFYWTQKQTLFERLKKTFGTQARIEKDETDDSELWIWEASEDKALEVKREPQTSLTAARPADD